MSTFSNLNLNAEAYTPARSLSPSAKPYRPGKPITVDEDWEVLEKAIGLVLENMPRDRMFGSNWNLPKVSRFA
jgi:hypothetical protein